MTKRQFAVESGIPPPAFYPEPTNCLWLYKYKGMARHMRHGKHHFLTTASVSTPSLPPSQPPPKMPPLDARPDRRHAAEELKGQKSDCAPRLRHAKIKTGPAFSRRRLGAKMWRFKQVNPLPRSPQEESEGIKFRRRLLMLRPSLSPPPSPSPPPSSSPPPRFPGCEGCPRSWSPWPRSGRA